MGVKYDDFRPSTLTLTLNFNHDSVSNVKDRRAASTGKPTATGAADLSNNPPKPQQCQKCKAWFLIPVGTAMADFFQSHQRRNCGINVEEQRVQSGGAAQLWRICGPSTMNPRNTKLNLLIPTSCSIQRSTTVFAGENSASRTRERKSSKHSRRI